MVSSHNTDQKELARAIARVDDWNNLGQGYLKRIVIDMNSAFNTRKFRKKTIWSMIESRLREKWTFANFEHAVHAGVSCFKPSSMTWELYTEVNSYRREFGLKELPKSFLSPSHISSRHQRTRRKPRTTELTTPQPLDLDEILGSDRAASNNDSTSPSQSQARGTTQEIETSVLRSRNQDLEAEVKLLKQHNVSQKGLLTQSAQQLKDEQVKIRMYERSFKGQHGQDSVFNYLDQCHKESFALRSTMKTLFGSFRSTEFPPSTDTNAISAGWEKVAYDITSICDVQDCTCTLSPAPLCDSLRSQMDSLLYEDCVEIPREGLLDSIIRHLTPSCMMRYLTGAMMCTRVFQSQFPDFLHGNPIEREKIYTLIALMDGPEAVQRANYAVAKLLIEEKDFTEQKLPCQASEWAKLLQECIKASCQTESGPCHDKVDHFWGDETQSESSREWIQSLFEQLINIKINILISPLGNRYRVQFFIEGSEFDPETMVAEDEQGCRIKAGLDAKVKLCLFPGLLQYIEEPQPEPFGPPGLASNTLYEEKLILTASKKAPAGVTVIAKAIVLVN